MPIIHKDKFEASSLARVLALVEDEVKMKIEVNDPGAPTSKAGIAIPQVTIIPSSGNRIGQLLINVADTTFNYYDGVKWMPIYSQVNFIGDLKYGMQNADHGGWIKMDGRSIASLNSSQKAHAIDLGFIDSLPNMSQIIYKSDPSIPLGQIAGSNTITLTQDNLPNVILSGTTSSAGEHSHDIRTKQDDWILSNSGNPFGGPSFGVDFGPALIHHRTELAGAHTHDVNIPLGGSGQSIDVKPKFLNSNSFIFLGN